MGSVRPCVHPAASAVADAHNALMDSLRDGEGFLDELVSSCEELIDSAIEALSATEDGVERIYWCLPPSEQQVLEQLIGVRANHQKALRDSAARNAELQAELDEARSQLMRARRDLSTARKDLKTQQQTAKEEIRCAEEAVRASRSYRLGNALGAPLRVVRSARDRIAGK